MMKNRVVCLHCLEDLPPSNFIRDIKSRRGYRDLCHHCRVDTDIFLQYRIRQYTSRVHEQMNRAKDAGLSNEYSAEEWFYALYYWKWQCAVCGSDDKLCPDHWIYIGADNCPGTVASNIVPMCASCNSSKGRKNPVKWLQFRIKSIDALVKLSQIEIFFMWMKLQSAFLRTNTYVVKQSFDIRKR
jgi:hypothetical protein